MDTSKIVKGNSLMIFLDGKSLAFATSHSLSISANTIDLSTKDHGYWTSSEPGQMSWEVTTENLYTEDDYYTLFDAMLDKTPLDIVWGVASDYDANGLGEDDDNWTAPTTGCYKGKVTITSLNVNAPNGENATYSCTMSGFGAIEKVATTNVGG